LEVLGVFAVEDMVKVRNRRILITVREGGYKTNSLTYGFANIVQLQNCKVATLLGVTTDVNLPLVQVRRKLASSQSRELDEICVTCNSTKIGVIATFPDVSRFVKPNLLWNINSRISLVVNFIGGGVGSAVLILPDRKALD